MTEDTQLEEIDGFLAFFHSTFETRPRMLGNAIQVNAMFYVVDQISRVRRLGGWMSKGQAWNDFLIEKKLIRGGRNLLLAELEADPMNFSKLQQLRREFVVWREKWENDSGA